MRLQGPSPPRPPNSMLILVPMSRCILSLYYHRHHYHCSSNGLLTVLAAPALNDLLKPKSEHVTPLKILLRIKLWATQGPVSSQSPLPHSPFPSSPLPPTWHMLLHLGLPDLANLLQCLRHAYSKKNCSLFMRNSYSTGHPVFFLSVSPIAYSGLCSNVTFSRLIMPASNFPNLSQHLCYTYVTYLCTWHSLPSTRVHIDLYIFCLPHTM